MLPLLYSSLSVVAISLVSIVLIYWLLNLTPKVSRFSFHLVSIAVGSLLGDAFIHILPEANEILGSQLAVSVLVIAGMLLFFALEKFIRWHHCHDPECHEDTRSHIVPVSIVGEVFHNFIDGVVIATAFFVSIPLGIATSLAVLIHEIPQEISDFGIYTHQGLTLKKALKLNLFSASFSFLGVFFAYLLGDSPTALTGYILSLTAGGFIYLAASDLIPELHRRHPDNNNSFLQMALVILGVIIMFGLLYLE